MSPVARRLVVMRHAKAEPYSERDHTRTLTDAGRRDARDAGRWLAEQGITVDHAYVSSAERTQNTWSEVAGAVGSNAVVHVDDVLYTAEAESVIEVLRLAPADAATVMYVGHNPTAAFVAHLLDDGSPDPEAFAEMTSGFPTSATTVLDVPVAWTDLAEGTCHIVAFHVGRGR